jgi:GH24 family phage-related lysozyme (muramidase)
MNTNVPNSAAMVVDYDVAMEVASHEAIIRQAYKDSEGVWTWSVGLTSATGHVVERYIGKPQSLEHCLRVYIWALDNYADAVRKAFTGVELSKEQFAAALSFHWNTGQIGKASWVRLFKAGKLAEAKKAFMNYSKPKAIVPRRQSERDLFFNGQWSNAGTMTEYTRVTAKGMPDWGSAKRIFVERELKAALAGEIPEADKVIVTEEKVVAVPISVEKQVVPQKVEDKVKEKSSWLTWLTGMNWQAVVAGGVILIVVLLLFILLRSQIISAVREIKAEVG